MHLALYFIGQCCSSLFPSGLNIFLSFTSSGITSFLILSLRCSFGSILLATINGPADYPSVICLFMLFAQFGCETFLYLEAFMSSVHCKIANIFSQSLSAFRFFLWCLWPHRFLVLCTPSANSFLGGFGISDHRNSEKSKIFAHSQIYQKSTLHSLLLYSLFNPFFFHPAGTILFVMRGRDLT